MRTNILLLLAAMFFLSSPVTVSAQTAGTVGGVDLQAQAYARYLRTQATELYRRCGNEDTRYDERLPGCTGTLIRTTGCTYIIAVRTRVEVYPERGRPSSIYGQKVYPSAASHFVYHLEIAEPGDIALTGIIFPDDPRYDQELLGFAQRSVRGRC